MSRAFFFFNQFLYFEMGELFLLLNGCILLLLLLNKQEDDSEGDQYISRYPYSGSHVH